MDDDAGEAHADEPARFRGGIWERGVWGATWPAGNLEITGERIRIWGLVGDLDRARGQVAAVRLSTGVLGTRVSLIVADGVESEIFFAAFRRSTVRRALLERGWPVVEDRSLRRWRGGPS